MLCQYCRGISIELLVQNAQAHGHRYRDSWARFQARFPEPLLSPSPKISYLHQPSYVKLVTSAQTGCSLCYTIWKECRRLEDDRNPGGLCMEQQIRENMRLKRSTGFRIWLGSQRKGWPYYSTLFDAVHVQSGSDALFTLALIGTRGKLLRFCSFCLATPHSIA